MRSPRRTLPPPTSVSILPRTVLILLAACAATACAPDAVIPTWFDAIHRIPVKTVVVDGHRIAYTDIGQGSPIILVHGFGGSMWQWEYQQEALARRHRVITLDMLGSGWSDKPDLAYTPDEIVAFFRAFMDALALPRAALVGNSMGGGLVIGMALTHPERVDRLVLIGALPDGVRERLRSDLMRRALDTWTPVWLVSLGNRLAGRGLTRRVLREMIHDERLITDLVVERSHRNRKRPGLMRPLMATVRNLPLWEEGFAKRIGEIRHPTLILWGTEDKVFSPEVGRHLQALIAGSRLELIPDAGHVTQWERPDLVNALILEFLG